MTDVGGIAADRLRSFVERIERLEEDRANLSADIREVIAEAKSAGFDARAIRELVKLRKLDPAERQEREHLLDVYRRALGDLDGTPLGDAGIRAGLRAAVGKLGRPVAPTEEEKAKGVIAAFAHGDGTRSSIAFPAGARAAAPQP
jgi:uncharacterized protein (UPF0335 family)